MLGDEAVDKRLLVSLGCCLPETANCRTTTIHKANGCLLSKLADGLAGIVSICQHVDVPETCP